jgi:hypothetical protein
MKEDDSLHVDNVQISKKENGKEENGQKKPSLSDKEHSSRTK